MASVQCHRSCEQSCHNQQQQHSSLGQKVSELFKGHHNNNSHCNKNLNSCSSATQQSRGKEHKKKNVFQKIKDGLSGDSSDSSSDSDSDDENCRERKN